MTTEEVLKMLRTLKQMTRKENEWSDVAIEALEKQISKKPMLKHDVSTIHINKGNLPHEWKQVESDNWHCSECDGIVGEQIRIRDKKHNQRKLNYCSKCGQAIDWSDEE